MRTCTYCQKPLFGRADKRYCDIHCKSADHYESRRKTDTFFFKVDRQLKVNRKVLKKYNSKGKTTIRKSTLIEKGFNGNFFTHFWRNSKGKLYLFCYEFGFRAIEQKGVQKYLLVQWQDYMDTQE